MLADGAKAAGIERFEHGLKISTAAAPPSPTIIEHMIGLNAEVLLGPTEGETEPCHHLIEYQDSVGGPAELGQTGQEPGQRID